MKLLFLGGKMHMKMLHGVKASLTKAMAMKGDFYEAEGWIGEIIVMGRTAFLRLEGRSHPPALRPGLVQGAEGARWETQEASA